jgi:hypothetical protein
MQLNPARQPFRSRISDSFSASWRQNLATELWRQNFGDRTWRQNCGDRTGDRTCGDRTWRQNLATELSTVRRLGPDAAAGSHLLRWNSDEGQKNEYTYLVFASTDRGKTWFTLAVGLHSPEFHVDRSQFVGVSDVMIRVVAIDGFTSSTSETLQIHLH